MSRRQLRRRRSHSPSRPPTPARTERAAPTIPDDSNLLEVMQWLLAGTYGFLRDAGFSQQQLSRELLQLQGEAYPARSVQRLMSRRVLTLSGVHRLLQQWCQELPFVHAGTGNPKSLRLEEGEASLKVLMARHLPKLSSAEALACLEEQGAILRQADGSYFPVQRYSQTILLELVALRACRYLQTGLRNLRAQEASQGYPDHATVTVRLRLLDVQEFLKLSDLQLRFAVGTMEMWMMDHHCEDPSEPCVLVNVHGYVTVEFETPAAGNVRPPRHRAKRPVPVRKP